jgi:hypothetical protein
MVLLRLAIYWLLLGDIQCSGIPKMQSQDRPPPIIVGDSAALDFLNTVAAPRATQIEWLGNGFDLLDWLVQSGLCSEEEVSHLRLDAVRSDLERATQDIRGFRDQLGPLFRRSLTGLICSRVTR